MNNRNRIQLTWISFLSYALVGALVAVTGIVMEPVANFFSIPVSSMSNTFTFLNGGMLIAIFLNAWLMEIIPLKKQLNFGFALMVLMIIALMLTHSLTIFSLCMFVLGVMGGITMSIGTFLITRLYDGRQRGSRLLFTDSFFSMASMILPAIAGYMLGKHAPWYWVYAVIGLIYVAIFVLTWISEFPAIGNKESGDNAESKSSEKWGVGVYILAFAALCYILGQLAFISWVPQYVQNSFHMSVEEAGTMVARFWMSYMIGMWVLTVVLRYVDLHKLVLVLSLLATVFMYMFNASTVAAHLGYWIIALGFVSSAIYTTIITLASQQTKIASPKLVNFVLTCGTTGTMLTFVVSSPIVKAYGTHAALVTADALYVLVFISCALLGMFTKHKANSQLEESFAH
ncbi:MFS transporter TsgA [Vibrio sp. S4M6]|uniref:MFS transporter TsgA n=1 Tax=Vibrio sinus TaxID=2946865 RepID=UPI002029D4C2|nr:MFS transporter TsgA [Vibrio sinus]MCL9780933.1 MFS transporter TsgA [Vibrio sinus]